MKYVAWLQYTTLKKMNKVVMRLFQLAPTVALRALTKVSSELFKQITNTRV